MKGLKVYSILHDVFAAIYIFGSFIIVPYLSYLWNDWWLLFGITFWWLGMFLGTGKYKILFFIPLLLPYYWYEQGFSFHQRLTFFTASQRSLPSISLPAWEQRDISGPGFTSHISVAGGKDEGSRSPQTCRGFVIRRGDASRCPDCCSRPDLDRQRQQPVGHRQQLVRLGSADERHHDRAQFRRFEQLRPEQQYRSNSVRHCLRALQSLALALGIGR